MTVRVVTDKAQFQSGVFSRPYLVRNSGATTVYFGQDSSLTPATRAVSLPPGSSLNWQGSTELWAVCATGQTGELEIMQDANSAFTPGPSTVNIAGTVPVSGSVDTSGSNVNVSGSVTTNLPVVTLLNVSSITYAAGAVYKSFNNGNLLDVSPYQTLRIVVSSNNIGPLTSIEYGYRIAIQWFSNSNLTERAHNSNYGTVEWFVTVKSTDMYIGVELDMLGPANNLNVAVYGYKVALPENYKHTWRLTGNRYAGSWVSSFSPQSILDPTMLLIDGNTSTGTGVIPIDHATSKLGLPFGAITPVSGTPAAMEWSIKSILGLNWGQYNGWLIGQDVPTFTAGWNLSYRNEVSSLPYAPIGLRCTLYGSATVRFYYNLTLGI